MGEIVNINGELMPPDKAVISIYDHGFLFGDSVYEVITTRNGKLYTVQEHLQRLFNSAKGIYLDIPYSMEDLEMEIKKTVKAAGNKDSYVRLMLTRGCGDLNIDPSSCLKPVLIIIVKEAIQYPEELYTRGMELIISSVKRNYVEAVNPGLKTGNYLNNVLAMAEALREGAEDALMLNNEGFITECSTSNFYFVKDGALKTSSLDSGVLQGVTRRNILLLAEENGIPCEEGNFVPNELFSAEEAFISSTTKNILPVTRLDGRPVGTGTPGEITRCLISLLEKKLDELVGVAS